MKIQDICAQAPVIPVLVIEELAHARPIGEALVAGGLPVLEVTLRSPVALEAIRIMSEIPGAVVGAGTVLNAEAMAASRTAGAQFAVSPGATPELLAAAKATDFPLLPGAVTASEVMNLLAHGYDLLKFFPADIAGGVRALKAFHGPFPQVRFCPTGGITAETVTDYLALPNVVCVGGSWVVPKSAIQQQDWDQVAGLARSAVASALT